ncbi:MAG TPA: HNH endonuclease [Longimicrobium sp.]|jgi:5-methylcytosine-specific restriction endonuclease McrA|uniref:HNH endonuclease n=1 Tax=Longimicrobium sp. TaxID=2029185 RepID=UPI002ED958B3
MPTMTTARATRRGCLTLNASYEPLVMLPVQRAVRLVMDGRAELVEAHGTRVVRSAGREVPLPAVIRLVRFVYVPRRMRRGVTNTILFARDGYACAYCGRPRDALRSREFLTRDHVLPQSRFARRAEANTWDNCVTACSTCNHRKADRTPQEAGMALRLVPAEPHFVHLEWSVRRLTALQRKYVAQFFGTDVADAL